MVTHGPDDNLRKLEPRADRLAQDLASQLAARGSVVAEPPDVRDVDEWRRAARRAGKLLGWRVRTGATPQGGAWVAAIDFEPSAEQARDAVERLGEAMVSASYRPRRLRAVRDGERR